jgi:peptidoglycan/LPS O-acetylase OafA/YrhL
MRANTFYRADIDGLRAIAVLLVVLFHANISFLTGGYIGVDVFFVLSGYLITATINKEMEENAFSFKQFYLRRIRRIIPVLVFILLVFTIPACVFLFADDLEVFARTLMHSFLSTNNFYIYANQRNYFADDSDLIILLHTWSLSVEEQFYVLWPILLLLMHRFLNSTKRLIGIVIFLVLSIFLSIYLTKSNPMMAYFLLPARIFELATGACLAMCWTKLPTLSKMQNSIISVVGLLLILLPAFVLNKTSSFPGINALWPCLGTGFLIFTGKNDSQKGIINIILKNKLLVQIGLISYSMYLWHWPIFTFIKYLGVLLEGGIRIAAFAVLFVVSYLSWRYIEQPFRTRFVFDFKKTLLFIMVPSLIIIVSIYAILDAKDGFPNRFPQLPEFNSKANYPNKLRKNCFDKFIVGNCEECFLGTRKDTLDGLLIGDSFGNHTASFLDVLAKDAGLYIHDCTAGGYPVLNTLAFDGTPKNDPAFAIKRMEYAKQFKTIFIAANWIGLSEPQSKNYTFILKTIGDLIAQGKKIVIFDCLRATDEMNLHRVKLFKSSKKVFFSQKDFSIPFTKRANDYIVYEMKKQYPSIIVVDLNDAMCKDGKCDIEINGTIVYRSFDHLNTSGAKLIGEKYLKLKGNPLKGL